MTITYKIVQDEWPESPREWDNLGTIATWARNYKLGEEKIKDRDNWYIYLASQYDDDLEYKIKQLEDKWAEKSPPYSAGKPYDQHWAEFEKLKNKKIDKVLANKIIILPIYMYDHSGICINTTGYSCGWDSGQVGYIYVSVKDAKKEYGWKRMTKERKTLVESHLRGEVETYSTYLEGDVWGYMVVTGDFQDEILDSCYGFYGYSCCEEEAKSSVAYFEKKRKEEEAELIGETIYHGATSTI